MRWSTGWVVEALVSMRAEVIPLGLEEVSGEAFAPIGVVKGQSGAEGRDGDAFFGGGGHNVAPGALRIFDGLFEEGSKQQVRELGVLVEGFLYFTEENAADDAAAAPH